MEPLSSCCCDAITEFKVDFKAFNDMHVKYAACFSLITVNGIVQVTLGLNSSWHKIIVCFLLIFFLQSQFKKSNLSQVAM